MATQHASDSTTLVEQVEQRDTTQQGWTFEAKPYFSINLMAICKRLIV